MVLEELDPENPPSLLPVKWIGEPLNVEHELLMSWMNPSMAFLNKILRKNKLNCVAFYEKCLVGTSITLNVGDFVLVQNAELICAENIDSCDVARILKLYELRTTQQQFGKDKFEFPYRAIVQWYSRPSAIPEKHFDKDNICVDFDREVIEEHRLYDADISLETVYCKCQVIYGRVEDNVDDYFQNYREQQLRFEANKENINCPLFVCRYKYDRILSGSYLLQPLIVETNQNDQQTTLRRSTRRRKSTIDETQFETPKRTRVRSSVGNLDLKNGKYDEAKVMSPIITIGDRIRASALKRIKETQDHCEGSPPKRLTKAVAAMKSPRSGRKKESPVCLNYSIVKDDELQNNDDNSSNNIKIRLRISRQCEEAKNNKNDEKIIPEKADSYQLEDIAKATSKLSLDEVYSTPRKQTKKLSGTCARRSILKSGNKSGLETPKRNIKMSELIEKRLYYDDEKAYSPTVKNASNAHKNLYVLPESKDEESEEEEKPKSIQKTPKKSILKNPKTPKKALKTPSKTPQKTPKLKMLREGEIQPSCEKRTTTKSSQKTNNNDDNDLLQNAREMLHVSAVPSNLPCREKEYENVYTFLAGRLEDCSGGCMYISGVPGTGKTATVTAVIRNLQKRVDCGKLAAFDYLEVNAMRLTEPHQAYVEIYRQLFGKTVSWENARTQLVKHFTSPTSKRKSTIILIDELDILCNRRQDVIYNLLDWPTKEYARLIVITIANTMDLPERLLMGKITSRLGLTRLTFQPYNFRQLQEIVAARLKEASDMFQSDAIQLVARKVAAVSGDARRALDICRRATEILEEQPQINAGHNISLNSTSSSCVNMIHVQRALSEMISNPKVQAIRSCCGLEKNFLRAIECEVTRTGVEETTFYDVYKQLISLATFMGDIKPPISRVLGTCAKLSAQRLIISEHSRFDIYQKIMLNVSIDDIHYGLKPANECQ